MNLYKQKLKTEHIAFIPARKGSLGFKNKNLIFFRNTGNLIKKCNLFDRVIVSTNDERIKKISKSYNFEIHNRSNYYSGHKTSIKETVKNFIKEKKISFNSIIWIFYLPILYKNITDFKNAKVIGNKKNFISLCAFKKVDISPFNCWFKKKNKIYQYIKNDYYRRQDLPETYTHHHY